MSQLVSTEAKTSKNNNKTSLNFKKILKKIKVLTMTNDSDVFS